MVSTRPKKGRSARGTEAYVDVPAVRTKNISILAAMNRQRMIYNKVHGRALNEGDFKACLIKLKEAFAVKGIHNPIFIMDNARTNHYSGILATIEELRITVVHLPLYSPFLNPIGNCFSKWKNEVIKKRAANKTELKRYIQAGFECITEEDCNGYYRKMLRYVISSERMEEIFE
ncbi:hypothetical protein CDIK_0575 [Cucumispora dikerogammari]|nr:hypothetical protein CDIK_0575 [Cucumispora dikerogammari]